ncbi:MAG: enoyl-CoA hydratase/isomerase family protein [Actinomycetota bacterium]
MAGEVRYEVRGAAAWVIIDREEQRNALSPEVVTGLRAAIERVGADESARVVVVTGAGDRAFCAGGDLGGMSGEASRVAQHEARRHLPLLLEELHECPKPVLARVNGHALAGGFGLMLACDLVVAADDAELGTPEINLGLWPYMISAVIQRNVPRKIALEMMLTGRRVSAGEAARWGMVNRVVPRTQLDAAAEELVADLAGKSPLILSLGKRSFYRSQDMSFDDALAYLHSMLTVNLESEDVAEGVSAFLQKRPPQWKGR